MECDRDDMIQLKWDNFGDTVIDSFRKFRTAEMLCDVTIWTEEDSVMDSLSQTSSSEC